MAYITSRGRELPADATEMRDALWFNMWQRKLWPYEELLVGDTLYWYESPSGRIVWKSLVSKVDRFQYHDKGSAETRLESKFGSFDTRQSYWLQAPDHGYCLAYEGEPQERTNIPKPGSYKFPRQGWFRLDSGTAKAWGIATSGVDDLTLDVIAPPGSLHDKILALNRRMAAMSPERVKTVVTETIRRDTPLVTALKELCKFCCQFPGCGTAIPKRGGGFYVEVAHIQPVSQGGRSVIGNIVVLCPNHHKEMDYGTLEITAQTPERVCGRLNGKDFEIALPGLLTKPCSR